MARGSHGAVGARLIVVLDDVMIRGLHVEAMRRGGLHPEHEPHVVFQASTIGALLDGAYEGDLSFAELAEHGDLGLGTLDHLDGEMIALDGRFYRADVDGRINEVAPDARTPFGVVVWFEPSLELELSGPLGYAELSAEIDAPFPQAALPGAASGRPIRLGAGALGPAPAPALPAAGRGRRRPARLRVLGHRGLAGRLPLSGFRRGTRGRAAITCTSSPPTATTAATSSAARCARGAHDRPLIRPSRGAPARRRPRRPGPQRCDRRGPGEGGAIRLSGLRALLRAAAETAGTRPSPARRRSPPRGCASA